MLFTLIQYNVNQYIYKYLLSMYRPNVDLIAEETILV